MINSTTLTYLISFLLTGTTLFVSDLVNLISTDISTPLLFLILILTFVPTDHLIKLINAKIELRIEKYRKQKEEMKTEEQNN